MFSSAVPPGHAEWQEENGTLDKNQVVIAANPGQCAYSDFFLLLSEVSGRHFTHQRHACTSDENQGH